MSDANKKIVRRVSEEVVLGGNFAVLDELVAEDVVLYDVAEPDPVRGREAYRDSIETYRNAFPNMRVRFDDQIAEGDRVVTRFTVSGRHDGDLPGIPATGKDVEFTGIFINRIENGRIVEEWDNWDSLGLMQQLGVVPAMAT